jgi:hypothetical protein
MHLKNQKLLNIIKMSILRAFLRYAYFIGDLNGAVGKRLDAGDTVPKNSMVLYRKKQINKIPQGMYLLKR